MVNNMVNNNMVPLRALEGRHYMYVRGGGLQGGWLGAVGAGPEYPPKKENVWNVMHAYFVLYTYFIVRTSLKSV
jgi:hypothetical protein